MAKAPKTSSPVRPPHGKPDTSDRARLLAFGRAALTVASGPIGLGSVLTLSEAVLAATHSKED